MKNIFDVYEKYKDSGIRTDFISHQQITKTINKLDKNFFEISLIGNSIKGKDIYSIKFGKGKTKILAWSQMHGDEPTATSALFDLFNFFSTDDEFNEIKKEILEELEIHIIPMLNPDGAEVYKRENSFNIDLNRDAVLLQSDESNILWKYSQKLKPDFAFNLHDQNSYYAVGRSNKTAAVSFLAPPLDYSKSINYTREKSMQVIALLNDFLSQFVNGHIARYKDDFEPRAFGDNLMKSGISTILIESGYFPKDENKDFIRKLNFISILYSLQIISRREYQNIFYGKYFDIPENNELFFDLVLRNLTLNFNYRKFIIDIGIKRSKKFNVTSKTFYYESKISAIGDLSIYYGLEEFDLTNHEILFEENFAVDSDANFIIYKNELPIIEIKNGFLIKKE
ncbi:MAG: M14 family zinc carboxypeptidase [Melioribacteraceae bacterium]|nr:M14 family zinc carboxypeptidase [Melioribacteraceae bacterium]